MRSLAQDTRSGVKRLKSKKVPVAKRAQLDGDIAGGMAGAIPLAVAEPISLHVTAGDKRPCAKESSVSEVEYSGSERAARRARLALVERAGLALRIALETELSGRDS